MKDARELSVHIWTVLSCCEVYRMSAVISLCCLCGRRTSWHKTPEGRARHQRWQEAWMTPDTRLNSECCLLLTAAWKDSDWPDLTQTQVNTHTHTHTHRGMIIQPRANGRCSSITWFPFCYHDNWRLFSLLIGRYFFSTEVMNEEETICLLRPERCDNSFVMNKIIMWRLVPSEMMAGDSLAGLCYGYWGPLLTHCAWQYCCLARCSKLWLQL